MHRQNLLKQQEMLSCLLFRVVFAVLLTSFCRFQELSDVLKVDRVDEFSVVPSSNPTDHFTAAQAVAATSVGLDRLPSTASCQPRLIEKGDLKMYAVGAHRGPHTLIMSIEMVRLFGVINLNEWNSFHVI